MQSTSVIILILVCIGVLCVSKAGGEICFCSCCVGVGCKFVEKPSILIPSCENGTCSTTCVQTYRADCGIPGSYHRAMCVSAASIVFSRYTIFTTFALAFTAMKGLRF